MVKKWFTTYWYSKKLFYFMLVSWLNMQNQKRINRGNFMNVVEFKEYSVKSIVKEPDLVKISEFQVKM